MKTVSKLIFFVVTFLAASAYAADDSPLFEAVKNGDKTKVADLLARGADVNAKKQDEFGYTPLQTAAEKGYKGIAELLLAKGADVSAKDKINEWTSLHSATYEGKKDVAELLLAKGANVNARDIRGQTPLHTAAAGCPNSSYLLARKEVAALLLAKGADALAKDKHGRTPLELILWQHSKAAPDRYRCATSVIGLPMIELLEGAVLKAMGSPRAVLVELTARLEGNSSDDNTRRLILKLASELKPAPAIPEEARKHFVEGAAIVKAAKNPAQQALAAQSFTEALKVAPWWGDAYYNLGVAQELAEKYDAAEQAFNFYLLSNPKATEKREVQDRIYVLSAKRKLLGAK